MIGCLRTSTQSLRFILSLRLYSSFIISGPGSSEFLLHADAIHTGCPPFFYPQLIGRQLLVGCCHHAHLSLYYSPMVYVSKSCVPVNLFLSTAPLAYLKRHLAEREHSGSVVECLTRDRRAPCYSLTGVTVL